MQDIPFSSLSEFLELLRELPGPDATAKAAAERRNGTLTKPPVALGRLEELAIWFASWRGDPRPLLRSPQVVVFAGNHGVALRGVSAFPSEVTAQMVANFETGGAAINQLAACFGARLDVVALDLDRPTGDFTQGPAMAADECLDALRRGYGAVGPDTDLFIAGDMGIGNTTAAAAIAAALLGGAPEEWVGRGTGINDAALRLKAQAVASGLSRHRDVLGRPLEVLCCLGGRELAAIAGAIAAARMRRIPVLLDGFICCAAALVLHRAAPGALDHAIAGHLSAEGAHGRLLEALGKRPLLDLGMRLGEGSGAALAIGVVRGALACHSGMATFAEAGVSDA